MKLKSRIVLLPCLALVGLGGSFAVLLVWFRLQPGTPDDVAQILRTLLWWSLGIAVPILLMTAWLAWKLAQKITLPMHNLASIAHEIADGNLSSADATIQSFFPNQSQNTAVATSGETGQLFEAIAVMTANLNSLVGQVQRSGVQVAVSSAQLFATAKWQESTVVKQTESMESVRKSVEEVAGIITELADTMHQVAAMSQEAAAFASSGQAGLGRMSATMLRMEMASIQISEKLGAINHKTDAITAIVTAITKVSEQTNLLSLNASIEAEKAGEYGRGFSVIAREIRRLADQTAVATLDIERMVREMQSAVAQGVMEMDKFIHEMRTGVDDVSQVGEQLSKIIAHVQALSPNFESVNVAMEHQSRNTQGITTEMTSLSNDMTYTRTALQESYVALQQLNEAAQTLQTEVSRFQLNASILNEIEIFQPFPEDAKAYLHHHMQNHPFSPGSVIIRQGERSDSLYIVAKGVVSVQIELPDGKMLEVGRKAVGEVFGEISLLTGEPRTANVLGLTEGSVFELKKTDIAPFIEADPAIAERFSAMLTTHKLDTEAKRNRYAAHPTDRDTIYQHTLHQIRDFFGLDAE